MTYSLKIIGPIFAVLSLTGCFTGIESTPKITANDVKKEKVVITPEEKYLEDIKPVPFDKWEPGKLFFVTDDKISLALEPSGAEPPKTGTILSYVEYAPVLALTGENETQLKFLDSKGNSVYYRVNASPEELKTRDKIDIPFTIEMSIVDGVREKLLGKTMYVRTSHWYDNNGDSRRGMKFIPVEITDIQPGNMVYPVKVFFKTPTAPDTQPYLLMSVGENTKSGRSFASLFYFDNPHKLYPSISDENWELITKGIVKQYMTREECRLALGAPNTVDRHAGISTLQERWGYENGIYLIFDDGLLQSFRR